MTRLRRLALVAGLALAALVGVPHAYASPSGGSGGAWTAQTFRTFTSAGITSRYHVFADGLDQSREVGMLVWADGSGGYGFDNPNSSYALGGTNGLRAVAKRHNMVLVVPEAPAPNCDGHDNCWYNDRGTPTPAVKAGWARDLVLHLQSRYPIETDRVAIGGYSSGAQFTSRWFVPLYGPQVQTDGVFVPVSYGGAPASGHALTAAYKAAVVGHWDTGTADTDAYSTASYGARGGRSWYQTNGFTTSANWVQGGGHARDGQFGRIMDEQIALHVRPAAPLSPTTTTTAPSTTVPPTTATTAPPAPTTTAPTSSWTHAVTPTRRGARFVIQTPAGYRGRTYVRLSTGYYLYSTRTGQVVLEFTSQPCGRTIGYTLEAPSGTPRGSGSFTTLSCR